MFGGVKRGWLMWPWKEVIGMKSLSRDPPVLRAQEASTNIRVLKAHRDTDQNHK